MVTLNFLRVAQTFYAEPMDTCFKRNANRFGFVLCSQDESRLTEERQASRQINLTARTSKEEI